MYFTGNKKMLNMCILDILKRYTDEKHHVTQQKMIRLLEQDYGMECDRRSVKNNVEYLNEFGYEIIYDEGYWLLTREFEDAELKILIDSVLSSKSITTKQAKGLIAKLEKQSSKYFETKSVQMNMEEQLVRTENKQVLYTISTLNDAIEQQKKVHFQYGSYDTDFRLHNREVEYIVNPYQMIVSNGRYYLLGNMDKYDNISYYRIDKIMNIEITQEKRKLQSCVKGLENGFSLPKHLAEHVYMFGGPSSVIKIRSSIYIIDDLIDWFGKDIRIVEKDEEKEEMIVRLRCNVDAMFFWALQYGLYVEVLEPKELREEISDAVKNMDEKYRRDRYV